MAENCDVCGAFMKNNPSLKHDRKWRCIKCGFTKYEDD